MLRYALATLFLAGCTEIDSKASSSPLEELSSPTTIRGLAVPNVVRMPFHVDESITAPELDAAVGAASDWATWTEGRMVPYLATPEEETCNQLHFLPKTELWGPDTTDNFVAYWARDTQGCHTIWVFTDCPQPGGQRASLRHEFGHAFGLEHHDRDGVMNGEYARDWFTDADAAACVSAGVCREALE